MHFFEYHKKSQTILQQAHKKYGRFFEEWISDESIEARYYLLEYLSQKWSYIGGLEKDEYARPIPLIIQNTTYYWSISHSENFIAYIVSEKPVGIDIAEYEIRERWLLDIHLDFEYSLLGEKDWLGFYKLWTAKEAIIKQTWSILDDMKSIFLREKKEQEVSLFEFHSEIYRIRTIIQDDLIVSFSEIC